MVQKKYRIPVVLDTNSYIIRFLKHKRHGVNRRVYDLWIAERKLQLIVSPPIIAEYIGTLRMLGASEKFLRMRQTRFTAASNVTLINVGKRLSLSRDPKDNVFLETAHAGKANFLITRDHDLLDIPKANLRGFRFKIVTPSNFLQQVGE